MQLARWRSQSKQKEVNMFLWTDPSEIRPWVRRTTNVARQIIPRLLIAVLATRRPK